MSATVEGSEAEAPYQGFAVGGVSEPRRRSWPSPVVGLFVAVVLAILGAPLGLLWKALAPVVPLIKVEGGARLTEPQPEEYVAADGWFTLLGLGFGIVAAILVWLLVRRSRGPAVLLGVAVGTVGAALVAWWIGTLGHGDFEGLVASAPVGTPIDQPADLRAGGFEWLWGVIPTLQGDVLLPAFGAVVTYTLLAGWSRYPSLVPEKEPAGPLMLEAAPQPVADGTFPGPWAPPPATERPPMGPDWRPQPINGMGIDGGGPTLDTMPGAGPWATPPPGAPAPQLALPPAPAPPALPPAPERDTL